MQAAKSAIPVYSEEEYERRREKIFATYDREREMNVGGNIVCKTCKQPTVYDDPEHRFIVRCACRCRLEAAQQSERAKKRAERLRSFRAVARRMNVLGTAYEKTSFFAMSLADAEQSYIRAAERCEKFCVNFEAVQRSGHGIWLWGDAGVGKTFFGACMLHALEEDGRSCIFTSAERILDEVRATFKSTTETAKEIKALLLSAEVLFIDRIDEAKGTTENAVRTLAEIVRSRDDDLRPTVVLSRISLPDYAAQSGMDGGILDRMSARMASIRLVGKNRFLSSRGIMEF